MIKNYKLVLTAFFLSGSILLKAQTWTPIGAGNYTSTTSAIAFDGNDIYANNTLTVGSDVFSFGKFSSNAWSVLGDWKGVPNGIGVVNCAIKIGDDIYVGGNFTDAAGNSNMDRIARWNTISNTWHALDMGLNSYVTEMVQMGTDLIVAGKFTNAGGDPNADYIAKWNGTQWSAISSTAISASNFTVVSALAVNGTDLYIGGNFENAGGNPAADYITRFDGTTFHDVYGWGGQVGAVYEITFDNNNLYIGGEFPMKIAKHNGTVWGSIDNFSVGSGSSWISEIDVFGSDIYIGGKFIDAKGITDADNIAKFDGTTWSAVAGGLNDEVFEIVIYGGEMYVGGKFTDAGGNVSADKFVKLGINTSIKENDLSSISVYPNPTNGIVQVVIENNTPKTIELFNVIGEKLISNKIQSNQHQLDLTAYPTGVYFLKIDDKTTKIIKQ
ncbi:MAG: T9SS type A sorting domain-containing protein [Flavobacteriales bacterium]|nr:T9SS type A sorting domain-containing protein [Flavobacteriales bacterium]